MNIKTPSHTTANSNPLSQLERLEAHFHEGLRCLQELKKTLDCPEKWVTAREFAEELGIKVDTLSKYRRQGLLKKDVHWKYVCNTPRKPSYRYKSGSWK